MPLMFKCQHCGQDVVVRYLKVGDQVKCPSCGQYGVVPGQAWPIDQVDAPGVGPVGGTSPDPGAPGDSVAAEAAPGCLAARWKRFLGHLIDSLVVLVPAAAVGILAGVADGSIQGLPIETPQQWLVRFYQSPWAPLLTVLIVLATSLQTALLVTRGQTVGKWVLGTRIVTMSNQHPSWWRLVLVRPLIILVAAARPQVPSTDSEWGHPFRLALGGLFLVNALLVFSPERRALHDYLAGTQVVDLKLLRRSGCEVLSPARNND
jgi:uncharacterized RDD family membrane protein YckC